MFLVIIHSTQRLINYIFQAQKTTFLLKYYKNGMKFQDLELLIQKLIRNNSSNTDILMFIYLKYTLLCELTNKMIKN